MSCENERQAQLDAVEAHAAVAARLKRFENAIFGGTFPPPILLSDQDVETLRRLDAEVEEAAQLEREKALAYEEAKRSHTES